ncbi:YvrJ family protein [Lentibacillus sp. L22]
MSDDVSAWADLLRGVGFPIVITAYLLLRFEKK